jgi:hypothetical protein
VFVDEYDRPCTSALGDGEMFAKFTALFREFFAALKAAPEIAFLFVTGSSRLPLQGIFSGPNDITDLTYEPVAALALGYTWEMIQKLYGQQLEWLVRLHDLELPQLKEKMEFWFSSHRWSRQNAAVVFNPFSVNMFVKTGVFAAHWGDTGMSSHLFSKNLFGDDTMRLLLNEGARMSSSWSALKRSKEEKWNAPLSAQGQMSVLVSSGILSIARDFDVNSQSDDVWLEVPNEESRIQAELILQSSFAPFVTVAVREAIERYQNPDESQYFGDAVKMLVALDACGAIRQCAFELAGRGSNRETRAAGRVCAGACGSS